MDTIDDTYPDVALNLLDDGTWAVWCSICDRQIGDNGYESEAWATELLKAHRQHH